MKNNLKKYSPKYVIKLAQELRKNMTATEEILWSKLYNKNLNGLRFRRQHPIDRYIVDFYCHEKRLIIEIDGDIHNFRKKRDENKEQYLKARNYTVLRFSNDEITHSINPVLNKIRQYASEKRMTKKIL